MKPEDTHSPVLQHRAAECQDPPAPYSPYIPATSGTQHSLCLLRLQPACAGGQLQQEHAPREAQHVHGGAVHGCAVLKLTPGQKHEQLLTCSADCTLRLWKLPSLAPLLVSAEHSRAEQSRRPCATVCAPSDDGIQEQGRMCFP